MEYIDPNSMKVNEVVDIHPVIDSHALFEADLEKKVEIVKNLFKRANKYAKDHHLTDIAAQKAYEKELGDLQRKGIKISDIHKFTGFFRKHPKLIGAAVGILFFLHKFFINAFEPSNCEANLSGPNTLIFFSFK